MLPGRLRYQAHNTHTQVALNERRRRRNARKFTKKRDDGTGTNFPPSKNNTSKKVTQRRYNRHQASRIRRTAGRAKQGIEIVDKKTARGRKVWLTKQMGSHFFWNIFLDFGHAKKYDFGK